MWQGGRGVRGMMSSQIWWKSAAVCGRGAWLMLPQRGCSVSRSLLRDEKYLKGNQSWDMDLRGRGPAAQWAIPEWTDRLPRQAGTIKCTSHSWFWQCSCTGNLWGCFLIPGLKGTKKRLLFGVFFSKQRTWLIVNLLGTEQGLYLEYLFLLP